MKQVFLSVLLIIPSTLFAAEMPTSTLIPEFLAIKRLHSIAKRVTAFTNQKYDIGLRLGKKSWPKPNPYYWQTNQGLILQLDIQPQLLKTPFGAVYLFEGGLSSNSGFLAVTHEFFNKHNIIVAFQGFSCQNDELKVHEKSKALESIKQADGTFLTKELTKEEVAGAKGSNRLLWGSMGGHQSVYHILQVGDIVLPQPQELPRREFRDPKEMGKFWVEQQELYKKMKEELRKCLAEDQH